MDREERSRSASTGAEYLHSDQKRRLDVLGSIALLGVSSPMILATGAACAVNARTFNPLLVQERSRGEGRSIDTLKFRTLTKDIGGIATDAVLGTFDPRSSRMAQTIRQLGLDEAPQLVNVLRGDMSLVGPRPVLESELERYEDADAGLFEDWYGHYSSNRPGLTGNSQLLRHHYRGLGNDLRARTMQLDIEYFETANLKRDIAIIAQTPLRMLKANVGVEDVSAFHLEA